MQEGLGSPLKPAPQSCAWGAGWGPPLPKPRRQEEARGAKRDGHCDKVRTLEPRAQDFHARQALLYLSCACGDPEAQGGRGKQRWPVDAAGGRLSHDRATELPASVSPALPPGFLLKEPERSDFSETLGPPVGVAEADGVRTEVTGPPAHTSASPRGDVPRRHSSRQHGASCPCWGWGGGVRAPPRVNPVAEGPHAPRGCSRQERRGPFPRVAHPKPSPSCAPAPCVSPRWPPALQGHGLGPGRGLCSHGPRDGPGRCGWACRQSPFSGHENCAI